MFFASVPIDVNNLGLTQINRPIDRCLDPIDPADRTDKRQLSIYGPYAYSVLKLATQAFLTLESGVVIRDTPGKPKIFDIEKERIRLNDFSLSSASSKKSSELISARPSTCRISTGS